MTEHTLLIIRVNQRQHSAEKLQKVFFPSMAAASKPGWACMRPATSVPQTG